MKRSVQEIIELLVFALVALVIGTGLLWVVGWLFGILGFVLREVAEFIWFLLKYIIPAAVIVAAVYALVKLAQNGSRRRGEVSPAGAGAVGSGPSVYSAPSQSSGSRSTLSESVKTAPQPTVSASPAPDTSGNEPPRVAAAPAPDEESAEGGAEDRTTKEAAPAKQGSSKDNKADASGENAKASAGGSETVGTEQAEPGEGFQEMVEDEENLPDDVQDKKSSEDKRKK